jgi:hypothetical protein
VDIGCREPHGQGDAIAIHDQVVFGAGLAAIDGVRSRLFAPFLARMLSESRLALDQSMAA